MSTATAFKYHRPFPFCLLTTAPSITGATAHDYVDVTLGEAMAIWWNLESLTIDVVGECSSPSGLMDGTFDVTDPLGYSPSSIYFVQGSIQAGEPRDRVCVDISVLGRQAVNVLPSSSGTSASLGTVILDIREISGQIRIYYRFLFRPRTINLVMVTNPAADFGASFEDTGTYGTITIAGVDFEWKGQNAIGTTIVTDPEITGYATNQFTY